MAWTDTHPDGRADVLSDMPHRRSAVGGARDRGCLPQGTAATRPPMPGSSTNGSGAALSEASTATAGAWEYELYVGRIEEGEAIPGVVGPAQART
jgi:hypothetical protein